MGAATVAPEWLGYVGPDSILSRNIEMISSPAFTTPESINEWNLLNVDPPGSDVKLLHSTTVGVLLGAETPTSMQVSYNRPDTTPTPTSGRVTARVEHDFHYPFQGPPERFFATAAIQTRGASQTNPVTIKVFLEIFGRLRYDFWTQTITEDVGPDQWYRPTIPMNSFNRQFVTQILQIPTEVVAGIPAAEILFPTAGDYKFGIEITISDTGPSRQQDVYADNLGFTMLGSSFGLLGTDFLGRDLWSQLIHGSRISLIVGLVSALLSIVIGLLVGLLAGFIGGLVDEATMRFTDMLLVLPGLPLLLVVVAVLGPSIWNLVMIIGLLGWMGFARVVRSQVLSLKERPFVEASKATGAGSFHITFRHLFPNILGLTYVSLALAVPSAIIAEAALSFLGLGDPTVPSWGKMLFDWQRSGGPTEAWWWIIPPGIAIATISMSFVLIGYALDEILNPRLRKRR